MNFKITLVISVFLMAFTCFAQEEKLLIDKDGLAISYQLLLTEEAKKKDSYLLIVNAVNESDTDLYYEVPLHQSYTGKLSLPLFPEEKGFTKIQVRNSTGLFGDGKSILGEPTELLTTNNAMLFQVKKNEKLSDETSFKVKAGETPLVTNSFSSLLKPLEEFDLYVTADMLKGDFVSSCGDFQLNLNVDYSEEIGEYFIQTTNGTQFIWLRTAETTFVRENFNEITLTYNKDKDEFYYSTADGINCSWQRL